MESKDQQVAAESLEVKLLTTQQMQQLVVRNVRKEKDRRREPIERRAKCAKRIEKVEKSQNHNKLFFQCVAMQPFGTK